MLYPREVDHLNLHPAYEYKGYKVYLPFISDEEAEAGWRCLGQSLDPTCALIVREEDDSSQELLVKVEHLNSFRNISKGVRISPNVRYNLIFLPRRLEGCYPGNNTTHHLGVSFVQ